MAGWLTAATGIFRKRTEDILPQTFEIRCACGRTIIGERVRLPQIKTCSACQQSLFVLPASVYPAPRPPAKKKVATVPRRAAATPSDELPTTASATATERPADRAAARTSRPEPASRPVTPAVTAPVTTPRTEPAGPTRAARLREALQPANLNRWRRKVLTPIRSVLLGVGVVIAATIWWLTHLAALERARDVILNVPKLAETALDEDDLIDAASHYGRLREAVELLGRDDQQSRLWRQLSREITASAKLVDASFAEIFQEAVDTASSEARVSWPDLFRAHYRDDWVLVDAPVSRVADDAGRTSFRVDYPLAYGTVRGRLVAELPAFEKRVESGPEPQRVIFAAQLADCRFDAAGEGIWVIELRPDTGFLWCRPQTFERLGLATDAATLKILAHQSTLVGLDP
ncbi:MAG: hypothetical protein EXS05_16235 [Planctomycetaceae bacterium]|nr:hypothetical protein [Planctomycetaceae bacterium]